MVNYLRIKGELSVKMGTKSISSSVVNYLRIKEEFGVLENSLPSVPSLFSIGKVKQKKVLSIYFLFTTFSPLKNECGGREIGGMSINTQTLSGP